MSARSLPTYETKAPWSHNSESVRGANMDHEHRALQVECVLLQECVLLLECVRLLTWMSNVGYSNCNLNGVSWLFARWLMRNVLPFSAHMLEKSCLHWVGSKFTRALTFQNLCHLYQASSVSGVKDGSAGEVLQYSTWASRHWILPARMRWLRVCSYFRNSLSCWGSTEFGV